MDIFLLLGSRVEEKGIGWALVLSLESPRADLMEEKIKELVDRDIQEHGRSTILSLQSPVLTDLTVTQSEEEYTSKATPLIWAACLGRTTLVEFFLSRGADINATDSHNRTALIWAADRGDLKTTLCLIKHGADLEIKENRYLSTALNWAAWRGRPGVVKALVEAGAVIDTLNIFGHPAIELGLRVNGTKTDDDNSFKITEILLKAGAQLPQRHKALLKRLKYIENHFSFANLFVQHGATVDETMFDQIRAKMGEEKENQLRAALSHKVPYNCNVFEPIDYIFFRD